MFKKLIAIVVMLWAAVAMAAVDVNKATAAELDAVKGIGPVTSRLILSERKKGDFKSWQDFIDRVKGVGESRAAKLSADGLTVGGAEYKATSAKDAKATAKDEKKDAKAVAKDEKKEAKATAKDEKKAAEAKKDAKVEKAEAKKDAKVEKAEAKKDAKVEKAEAKKDAKEARADAKADAAKPAASGAKAASARK